MLLAAKHGEEGACGKLCEGISEQTTGVSLSTVRHANKSSYQMHKLSVYLPSKNIECVTVFINHIALFINEDNDTLMLTLSLAVGKEQ